MDKNRELHELLGLCWHEQVRVTSDAEILCSCGKIFFPNGFNGHCRSLNPDYAADPRLVLKEMVKRPDWNGTFIYFIGGETHSGSNYKRPQELIPVDYILDTTGKLRDAAISFLKGGRDER